MSLSVQPYSPYRVVPVTLDAGDRSYDKKVKRRYSQKVERPRKLVRNKEKTEGNQQVKAIEKYRLSSD